MKTQLKRLAKSTLQHVGLDISRTRSTETETVPPDVSELNTAIFRAVEPFTMTGPARVNALVEAVRYVNLNNVSGALVECGVWKGGSAMAMAMASLQSARIDRDIYLYDTFSGMTAPGEHDVSIHGDVAATKYHEQILNSSDGSDWCLSPLEDVRSNVLSTGYPECMCHFVKGMVEDTIPRTIPEQIAILRLDTDWYESTRHELIHHFPRLQPFIVIIIDDYGHWKGARKAVDEYFADTKIPVLLNRIDVTCRVAVKYAA